MRQYISLVESFNSSSDIHWERKTDAYGMVEAYFEIGDSRYMVNFAKATMDDYFSEKVWGITFEKINGVRKYQPNNDMRGTALKVLSTVITSIREFIQTYKPEAFAFSGSKKEGLSRIYDLIVMKHAHDFETLGYICYQSRDDNNVATLFYRRDQKLDDFL